MVRPEISPERRSRLLDHEVRGVGIPLVGWIAEVDIAGGQMLSPGDQWQLVRQQTTLPLGRLSYLRVMVDLFPARMR